MTPSAAGYTLNQSVKDDKFSVDDILQYNLSLQVSRELFRLCVTDIQNNRCLLLEDYQIFNIQSNSALFTQLDEIFRNHTVLEAGFWKSIKLGIKNKSFSLVPDSLFEEEFARDYLSINSTINGTEVYYYKQKTSETINIFAADSEIIDWFKRKYPQKNIKVFHFTSPVIEGVMIDRKLKDEKSLYIVGEKNMLTILVKADNKLNYCNSFTYYSPEDFIYFVMFVFDQLKLNPEVTPVVLWGDISTDSPVYNKLYKYIRNVSFGNKPAALFFGYQFDEIFDHRFFDLYNMHFCD
jgi:hypothetical protein